jgi:hypothetical protein
MARTPRATKAGRRSELANLLEQRRQVVERLNGAADSSLQKDDDTLDFEAAMAEGEVIRNERRRLDALEEPLARVRALTHAAHHWSRHAQQHEGADELLYENVLDQLLMLLRGEVEGLHALYHRKGEG